MCETARGSIGADVSMTFAVALAFVFVLVAVAVFALGLLGAAAVVFFVGLTGQALGWERSYASNNRVRETCVYRCVVATLLCPSSS